jgi:hypothetical protein
LKAMVEVSSRLWSGLPSPLIRRRRPAYR